MRSLFVIILLHFVTLFNVSAHSLITLGNGDGFDIETLTELAVHGAEVECTELYTEDDYVFCEEVAPTRRPDEYTQVAVEIYPTTIVRDFPCPTHVGTSPDYPFANNRLPLSACYSFIVRLTPF